MMGRYSFWGFLVVFFLVLSCVPEKGSEDYLAPEIVSAEAVAGTTSASFDCVLSVPRAESCGIVYWAPGEPKQTISCNLSATSFSATVENLVPGKRYEWYAFVRAGENEVRSQTREFTTMEVVPEIDGIYIPDPFFKRYLLENFDTDGDGSLSVDEGLAIRRIEVLTDKISSVKGIELFKNLETLSCRGAEDGYDEDTHPGLLDTLDISVNRKLRHLSCDGNMLRVLKVGDNPVLEDIYCNNNLLEEIDLSGAPKLASIDIGYNNLKSLDLSRNTKLKYLNIKENNISVLSLPGSLERIACWNNPLGAIDVTNMPDLIELACANIGLTRLDVTHNPKLLRLAFNDNEISHIDLSKNPLLEELTCWRCGLKSLFLSDNPRIYRVQCWGNLITSLDVSRNPLLGTHEFEKDDGLHCSPMEDELGNNLLGTLFVAENQVIPGVTENRDDSLVPGGTLIKTIRDGIIPVEDAGFKKYLAANNDIDGDGEISYSEAREITWINMDSEDWNVQSLQGIEYMPNLTDLRCAGKWYDDGKTNGPLGTLRRVDVSANPKLVTLSLSHNERLGETIGSLDLSSNPELEEIFFSYNNLEYPVISHLTKLRYFEARGCHGIVPDFSGFTTLEYLELRDSRDDRHFNVDVSHSPDLREFRVNYTDGTISDLTLNPKLTHLEIDDCPVHSEMISSLVPRLPLLEHLSIGGNRITAIDLSNNPRIKYFNIAGNRDNALSSIDVSVCPDLYYLCCDAVGLSSLDVSHNPKLRELRCWYNNLSRLDLSNNPELLYLFCDDNRLTSLPLDANKKLEYINCSGNRLTSLDLSELKYLACLDCSGNLISVLDVSQNKMLGTGRWDAGRVGLYCANMAGPDGLNLLKTLYVSKDQVLPGITSARDTEHVPSGTTIVVK